MISDTKLIQKDFLRFRSRKPCFVGTQCIIIQLCVGSEAADWMVQNLCLNRKESGKLGNQLLKLDFVQSITKNQPFLDDPKAYYTFNVEQRSSGEIDLPFFSATKSFMDFHPFDVAEHLTMIEYRIRKQPSF